jgi:uncharacterized protein YggT (Ycf19 family)
MYGLTLVCVGLVLMYSVYEIRKSLYNLTDRVFNIKRHVHIVEFLGTILISAGVLLVVIKIVE